MVVCLPCWVPGAYGGVLDLKRIRMGNEWWLVAILPLGRALRGGIDSMLAIHSELKSVHPARLTSLNC